MSKTWLKEVLEENRRELDTWPDWKRSTDPTGSQKQSETNAERNEREYGQDID